MERSINLSENPYPAMTAECAEPETKQVFPVAKLLLPFVMGKEPAMKPAAKINIGSGEDVFC